MALLDDFRHHAGTHGAATFTDGEAQTGFHGDGGDQFDDELAVIEASSSDRAQPDYNSVYKTEPRFINHGSIMIYPKMDTFYIAENVYLPNYLYADSLLKENTGKFSYAIDLPQEVTFQPSKAWPADTRRLGRTETKNGRTILYFEPKDSLKNFLAVQQYGFGPFYFSVDHAEKIPAQEKYVIFTTYYNGRKALEVRRGIEFLKMPEVPQLKVKKPGSQLKCSSRVPSKTHGNFFL